VFVVRFAFIYLLDAKTLSRDEEWTFIAVRRETDSYSPSRQVAFPMQDSRFSVLT